ARRCPAIPAWLRSWPNAWMMLIASCARNLIEMKRPETQNRRHPKTEPADAGAICIKSGGSQDRDTMARNSEIHQNQPSTRFEHAHHFAKHRLALSGCVHFVYHEIGDDHIERGVRKG